MKHIAIIGASGGIGSAFLQECRARYGEAQIYALSRSGTVKSDGAHTVAIDIVDEESVRAAAEKVHAPLDMVIVATGLLHGEGGIAPEKSIRDICADNFIRSYKVNALGVALVGKHFLPLMRRDTRAIFAVLSARVGSVSDNEVGGWYAYRASKAALNMTLKNFAIEQGRRHKEMIIAGLQPGTVDTALSKPFQGRVVEGKLFTPAFAACSLLDVLESLSPADSGGLFDWQGKPFAP